ncbi:MAG: hypothetical protein LBE05_04835 [Microbacterium sp.]|jgi:hypothetical protein|nr:hypothetical protein [Microbacterium sp.]
MTENLPTPASLIENDSPSHTGIFAFDAEARTLRGNLLPLGVKSRPSVSGDVGYFTADTITLPRDPSVVTLNRRHERTDPVGRATVLEVRGDHVYAEFQLGDTDEADAWLTDERDTLNRLSAEVRYLDATKTAARLSGAALVTAGAFAEAGLFALDAEDEDAAEPTTHITFAALAALPEDQRAEVIARLIHPEEVPPTPDEEETTVSDLFAPEGLTPKDTRKNDSAAALFAHVASPTADGAEAFKNADALFAIQPLQETGPSGRTVYADTATPAALGELWDHQPYSQRFLPLLSQATLTSTTARGWRWVSGPEVGDYAGNLAEIPSNALDTEPVETKAQRIAGGHKLDRIYRDFNDTPVVESYFRKQTEDVARKLDAKALNAIVGAATPTVFGGAAAGVDKGMAALVDGALDVIATENRPAFALVAPDLYRSFLLTNDRDKLAFLNAGFGLEEGDFASFKIVPANIGAGKVIVGAREAVKFFTLPGSPIRVEGLDVHHGGIDVAVFAYWAALTENAAAVRVVDTTVTP